MKSNSIFDSPPAQTVPSILSTPLDSTLATVQQQQVILWESILRLVMDSHGNHSVNFGKGVKSLIRHYLTNKYKLNAESAETDSTVLEAIEDYLLTQSEGNLRFIQFTLHRLAISAGGTLTLSLLKDNLLSSNNEAELDPLFSSSSGLFEEYDRIFQSITANVTGNVELLDNMFLLMSILVNSLDSKYLSLHDIAFLLELSTEKVESLMALLAPFLSVARVEDTHGGMAILISLFDSSIRTWWISGDQDNGSIALRIRTLQVLQKQLRSSSQKKHSTSSLRSHYWSFYTEYVFQLITLQQLPGIEGVNIDQALQSHLSIFVEHMFCLPYLQERPLAAFRGGLDALLDDCRKVKNLLRSIDRRQQQSQGEPSPVVPILLTVIGTDQPVELTLTLPAIRESVAMLQRFGRALHSIVDERLLAHAHSDGEVALWWHSEVCTQLLGRLMFVRSSRSLPLLIQSLVREAKKYLLSPVNGNDQQLIRRRELESCFLLKPPSLNQAIPPQAQQGSSSSQQQQQPAQIPPLWKLGVTGDVTRAIICHKKGYAAFFSIESRGVSSAPDLTIIDLRTGHRRMGTGGNSENHAAQKKKVNTSLFTPSVQVLPYCLRSTGEAVLWQDTTIKFVDLEEQREHFSLVCFDAISTVCECDSIFLAVGFKNGRIAIYQRNVAINKQKKPRIVNGNFSTHCEVTVLCYDPVRRWLCSGDSEGRVLVWNYDDGSLLHCMQVGRSGAVVSVIVLPNAGVNNQGEIVTLNDGGLIQWWSTSPAGDDNRGSTTSRSPSVDVTRSSGANSPTPLSIQVPSTLPASPMITPRSPMRTSSISAPLPPNMTPRTVQTKAKASFNLLRRTLAKDQLFVIYGEFVVTKDQSGMVLLRDGKTITKYRGDYNLALVCSCLGEKDGSISCGNGINNMDDELDSQALLMIENPKKHEGATMSRAKSIMSSSGTSFIELRTCLEVFGSSDSVDRLSPVLSPNASTSERFSTNSIWIKSRGSSMHTSPIHGLMQRTNSQLVTLSDHEVVLWDMTQCGIHKIVRTSASGVATSTGLSSTSSSSMTPASSQIVYGQSGREPLILVGASGGHEVEYVDLFASVEALSQGLGPLATSSSSISGEVSRLRFPCCPTKLNRACVAYLSHRHFVIAYPSQPSSSSPIPGSHASSLLTPSSQWLIQVCDHFTAQVLFVATVDREITSLHCTMRLNGQSMLVFAVMAEMIQVFDLKSIIIQATTQYEALLYNENGMDSTRMNVMPSIVTDMQPKLCLETQGRVDYILEVKPGWLLITSEDTGIEAWNIAHSSEDTLLATREWFNPYCRATRLYNLHDNTVLCNSSPVCIIHALTGDRMENISSFNRLIDRCEPFTPYPLLNVAEFAPFLTDESLPLHSLFILDREKTKFATISGKDVHIFEAIANVKQSDDGEEIIDPTTFSDQFDDLKYMLFEKTLSRKEIH